MDKEIPLPSEKNSRAGRLRDAARRLQELPVDQALGEALWDEITGDLTPDALAQLGTLAEGALERATLAAADGEVAEALAAFQEALLLRPRDPAWTAAVAGALAQTGLQTPEARALAAHLARRSGRRKGRLPPWLLPALVAIVLSGGLVGAMAFWAPTWNLGSPINQVQGPRALAAVFDTQGVKTNIQVAQSRLIIFPESTVAELSAWVTFPDHRVDLWEGTVSVLDSQGQVLAHRDLSFRASNQGPLDPGQGLEVFQQFDAWPWFDRVASFQVSTSRILAKEAEPKNRQEMPVEGLDALTPGYGLRVWVDGAGWADRFASRVHTLSLELENTGLKPFAELELELVWKDGAGKTLKTLVLRPVSAFRTALPSGGRLPWTQETVFDTEVFSWPAGSDPHPVLALGAWK